MPVSWSPLSPPVPQPPAWLLQTKPKEKDNSVADTDLFDSNTGSFKGPRERVLFFLLVQLDHDAQVFALPSASDRRSCSCVNGAGANDQGLITTRGTISASCSVDDLSLTLSKQGNDKLVASGQLNVAQNGRTEWNIGKTIRQAGTNYSNLLTLEVKKGFGLNLTSH